MIQPSNALTDHDVRGTTEDFEYWQQELGCSSWGWESVQPFFNSIETDMDHGDEDFHGESGPVVVRQHPQSEWREADTAWFKACRAAGFEACEDSNAPGTNGGVGSLTLNNQSRVRLSSALTFLAQARDRPNLTVRGDSDVVRVVFSEGGDGPPTATGVELANGTVLHARSEVILCGGAIGASSLGIFHIPASVVLLQQAVVTLSDDG